MTKDEMYEAEKKKLYELNLTSQEYEEAIKKWKDANGY